MDDLNYNTFEERDVEASDGDFQAFLEAHGHVDPDKSEAAQEELGIPEGGFLIASLHNEYLTWHIADDGTLAGCWWQVYGNPNKLTLDEQYEVQDKEAEQIASIIIGSDEHEDWLLRQHKKSGHPLEFLRKTTQKLFRIGSSILLAAGGSDGSSDDDQHWSQNMPDGLFMVSSFTRPDLSYAVDPATGNVFYKQWMHIDEDGNDYYDQLSRDTRTQLYEYDRMKMAATCFDDKAVLDWFVSNAKSYGLSIEYLTTILRGWFADDDSKLEAA